MYSIYISTLYDYHSVRPDRIHVGTAAGWLAAFPQKGLRIVTARTMLCITARNDNGKREQKPNIDFSFSYDIQFTFSVQLLLFTINRNSFQSRAIIYI